METQLFFALTAKANRVAVYFCESDDLSSLIPTLTALGIALFEVEGASVRTREDLFKAFAYALRKPKGWYGDQEYAPNADAFLEYLDDVHKWVPANGHVVVVRGAEQLFATSSIRAIIGSSAVRITKSRSNKGLRYIFTPAELRTPHIG